MGRVAQRRKQARLELEATQAANQQDASVPQHQPKIASGRVSEQQHTPNMIEDTPYAGGGPSQVHLKKKPARSSVGIYPASNSSTSVFQKQTVVDHRRNRLSL